MRHALLHGATPADGRHLRPHRAPLPDPDAAPPADRSRTRQRTRRTGRTRTGSTDRRPAASEPLDPTGGEHCACPAPGGRPAAWRGPRQRSTPTAVRGLLTESITAVGAQVTWDDVVRPVLAAMAQRWVDTGTGIEIEHLLSDCVTAVFSALAAASRPRPSPAATARPVLLAGMAGDQHRLPLVVLSATLAQRGVACRSLGADLPADALVARDPPHRTRSGTAVVTTARHRRSRPAEVPAPYPARVPHLRRRPRLGRHHTRTTDRAAEFTARGHRRDQHVGIGVILPSRWAQARKGGQP